MWTWFWVDETWNDNEESSNSFNDDAEGTDEVDEDDEDTSSTDDIPAITHSVVFKCIGSVKKHEYQETLALVKKKMCEGAVIPRKRNLIIQ